MEGHTTITSLYPDGEPKSPKGAKTTVINKCGYYVRENIPISFNLWKKSKATNSDADIVPDTGLGPGSWLEPGPKAPLIYIPPPSPPFSSSTHHFLMSTAAAASSPSCLALGHAVVPVRRRHRTTPWARPALDKHAPHPSSSRPQAALPHDADPSPPCPLAEHAPPLAPSSTREP